MDQTCLSWTRFLSIAAAVLASLALACSDPLAAPDDQAGFEPREGVDPRARVRRVDRGFLSGVSELRVGPDGSTWLLRSEFRDSSLSSPPRKLLTRIGAGGERLGELSVPDFIQYLVVHPSGELTLVGWERPADSRTLQLRRIRPDGSLVAERLFRNDTPPEERLNYVAYEDGTVHRVVLPESQRFVGILAAEAHGEDLYLFANTEGLRVVRLDSALETRWVRTVAPSISLSVPTHEALRRLGAPFVGAWLAVDESGRASIALPLLPVARSAYVDAFGRVPEGPDGRAILIVGLESTGEERLARTVAAGHADRIVGLVVRGGAFAVGARANTPIEQPNNHFDFDLFFASGRLDRPASEAVTRTLTLDNDDEPEALVACNGGLYCFAGHTGHLVLDTGRAEVNGKGFILEVDARGEQRNLALLQGPRDTEVRAAVEAPGGAVVFAFSTNGPPNVAKAPPALKGNELWLGVLGAPE